MLQQTLWIFHVRPFTVALELSLFLIGDLYLCFVASFVNVNWGSIWDFVTELCGSIIFHVTFELVFSTTFILDWRYWIGFLLITLLSPFLVTFCFHGHFSFQAWWARQIFHGSLHKHLQGKPFNANFPGPQAE